MGEDSQKIRERAVWGFYLFRGLIVHFQNSAVRRTLEKLIWGVFLIWGALLAAESVGYYTYTDLGMIALRRCDYSKAEEMLLSAHRESTRFGHEDLRYQNGLTNLITCFKTMRRYDLAEPLAKERLSIRRLLHGEDRARVADAEYELAGVLYKLGKLKQAEALLTRAAKTYSRGDRRKDDARVDQALAQVYRKEGDHEKADDFFRKSISLWRQGGKADRRELLDCLEARARLLGAAGGDPAEAKSLAEEIASLRASFPDKAVADFAAAARSLVLHLFDTAPATRADSIATLERSEVTPALALRLRKRGYLGGTMSGAARVVGPLKIDEAVEGVPDCSGYVPVEVTGWLPAAAAGGQPMPFRITIVMGVARLTQRPLALSVSDGAAFDWLRRALSAP